jgi:hypothetical protein
MFCQSGEETQAQKEMLFKEEAIQEAAYEMRENPIWKTSSKSIFEPFNEMYPEPHYPTASSKIVIFFQ